MNIHTKPDLTILVISYDKKRCRMKKINFYIVYCESALYTGLSKSMFKVYTAAF